MVNIVSRQMIKPCTPTPQSLKNYSISLTDQLYMATNVPIILFYSPSSADDSIMTTSISRLKQSLANILPRFYPLAGRYVKEDHLVLCNDEGVDFVEARASPDSFKNISEYVQMAMIDQKLNDMLLPRLTCEADEVSDPMASIQVTRFPCGGLAIGLSISHKIFDANSVSTFVSAWAQEAKIDPSVQESEIVNPNFDGPKLLPFKKMDFGLDGIQFPRTLNPDIIGKRFSFDKDAVAALKAKVGDGSSRRVSKFNVVCALILKAVIHLDKLKHGRLRSFLVNQAVNIRDRTVPPFPKHSCGNIIAMSVLKLGPAAGGGDGDNMKLEGLVSSIRDVINKTIANCGSLFDGEGRYNMLYDPFMEMTRTALTCREEARVMVVSDWTKFEFYGADFGWGKPIWTSIGTMPVPNMMVLLSNKEGDGIEAWVHLFKEEMVLFEDIVMSLDGV